MRLCDVRGCVSSRLEKAGIETFEYETWVLMDHFLHVRREDYFEDPFREAEPEKVSRLEEAVAGREKRIPLQYLTGQAPFMGFTFMVDERVLIPRYDSESLVEACENYINSINKKENEESAGQKDFRILDLCTGSGCIGISLAIRCPGTKVTLSDVSPDALCVAGENAHRLGADVQIRCGDLFEAVPEKFNLIVSNPPYIPTADIGTLMPEVRDHEPARALDGREDGLYFYRQIVREAPAHLEDGGRLFMEIGWDQGPALREMLSEAGYTDIEIRQDLSGRDRIAAGTVIHER